jgi:hypothetical protein
VVEHERVDIAKDSSAHMDFSTPVLSATHPLSGQYYFLTKYRQLQFVRLGYFDVVYRKHPHQAAFENMHGSLLVFAKILSHGVFTTPLTRPSVIPQNAI